ncbi:MAG TPA: methyltransferase domain-containing protein [Candidatus Scalindua sp.]|nr:methyltransferase domain-containing protein [Candidatus Scalindua sp.]
MGFDRPLKHSKLMILDLGCGKAKREGAIGVDFVEMPGVDIVCDLNGKFPFPDNRVDGICASHIFERLDDFLFTMNEIWRICKPNVWVKISVPHSRQVQPRGETLAIEDRLQ